jgi:5-methylcytosine-specific restriction protein A
MRILKRTMTTLPARRIATLAERADGARRLSRSVANRQKLRVWLQQSGRCKQCGVVVPLTDCDLDHIKPLVDGGELVDSNTQALCRPCHKDKTATEISERAKRGRIDVQTDADP